MKKHTPKVVAMGIALLSVAGLSRDARADGNSASSPETPSVFTSEATPPKFKPRFSAAVDGGLAYRVLYGSHFWGGELSAAAGVDLKPGTLSITADLLYGKTEYGLSTWNWHVAPAWYFRFNRFRAGLGPSFSYLQIARVTTPDHPFYVVGLGAVAQVTADIVQWDAADASGRPTTPHAFYGGLRFNIDSYLEQSDSHATTYGPTFVLGYRY